MTTEKMTIHKALVELKTIESRIIKATDAMPFVVTNKHSNTKISGIAVSEYCNMMQSAYQRANDLIARRNAIKRAVVLSNAITKVVVGGVEYTVAEAIEMKNHGMDYLRALLSKLTSDYMAAQREANRNNGDALEQRADDYIRTMYGNTDMKNAAEEAKKMRADFIAAQTLELIDPIKSKDEVERLEKTINDFTVDVDAALSVSNATTEIEFSY